MRFVKTNNVLLICGDAFEVLPQLSIQADAVITDPPYGISSNAWDKAYDMKVVFDLLRSKTRPDAVFALFSAMPFSVDCVQAWRKGYRYDLIWRKSRPVGFLNAKFCPMRNHEQILVFGEHLKKMTYNPQRTLGKSYVRAQNTKVTNYNLENYGRAITINNGTREPVSVLDFEGEKKSYHPTQKPLALVKWLVNTYSNPGDVVLDPFMGSGTTAVACRNTDRFCIGIESNEEYFDKAVRRMKE